MASDGEANAVTDPGVQPALSSDGWKMELAENTIFWLGRNRHALAALALYGQPFGFTREDVALLLDMEDLFTTVTDDNGNMHEAAKARRHEHEEQKGLLSLAARIAALLPPEKG